MMAQVGRDFQGRSHVEACSGARVQAMGDGAQCALGVARHVRILGEVLAQQPIGVRVGAALSRTVRIGNEDRDGESLGQPLVFAQLFAPIVVARFAQQRGHVLERLREALASTPCRPVPPCQEDQACGPLHQGTTGRPMAGPRDEGAFPVAGPGAGRALGRARGRRLTQGHQQCAVQGSAWPHRQTPSEGLGREVLPQVIRRRALEASGNLFGRATLSPMCPHIQPQPGIHQLARSPWLTNSGRHQGLCGAGTRGLPPRRLAGRLAAHGSGRRVPTSSPSSAANGRGPGPGSRSSALMCR
jgi:hypothetical protein